MQLRSRFTRSTQDKQTESSPTIVNPRSSDGQNGNGSATEPDARRVTNEHAALSRDIQSLATSLGEIDARASGRLRDLSNAVNTPTERIRWNAVDLRQAFNIERLSHQYAEQKVGKQETRLIEFADKVRNVLVLLPVLLTWYALAEASQAYDRYLSANPDQVGQPFLLLWQQGFGGELGAFSPTFAMVALVDAAIIGVIILLTLYAHGRREDQEDRVAEISSEYYVTFDNTLAEAGVLLSRDRAAQPSQLAQNVAALTDRFDLNSREIIGLIDEERRRLSEIAEQRQSEMSDFSLFARSMRSGAEQTHRMLSELRQVSRSLDESVDRLGTDVSATGRHQETLLATLQNLEQMTSSAIQSDQAVTHRLAEAANAIAGSADSAVAGADHAAQVSDAAHDALRGMADLAQRLVDTNTQLTNAMNREHGSTDAFGSAISAASRQNTAVAEHLSGLTSELSGMRETFTDLADRTASQTRALTKMLEQQSTIAEDISRATRELGSAGMNTAQRNREAREDLARLAQRLDQLTTSLNRAAQQLPTTENLQRAFASALRTEVDRDRSSSLDEGAPTGRWSR